MPSEGLGEACEDPGWRPPWALAQPGRGILAPGRRLLRQGPGLGAGCPPEQVREEIPPGRTWWPQDLGSHERVGTPSTPEWDGRGGSELSQVGVGVARETGCPVWLSFHAQVINSVSVEPMLLPLSVTEVPGSGSWHAWGWGTCHLHVYPGLQLTLHRPLPRWSQWAELSSRLLPCPGSRCSCAEGPPAATCSRKMSHRRCRQEQPGCVW